MLFLLIFDHFLVGFFHLNHGLVVQVFKLTDFCIDSLLDGFAFVLSFYDFLGGLLLS
jgi:hypothetical protein